VTKQDRRKLIADRAATTPERGYATYWLTRSMRDGVVDKECQVWLVRPDRIVLEALGPGNVIWDARLPDKSTAFHGMWDLGQCLVECRVHPDDSLMAIRVGPEPEPEVAGAPLPS